MAVKQIIRERIELLREKMHEFGIDLYLVPLADFHNSEYVSDYFKAGEFLSGFTGSNATLLISAQEAGLWTDGRYFIQAEKELDGTGITLYRMGEEGVPSVTEYIESHLQEGDTLGFDGRVIEAAFGRRLEKRLEKPGVQLQYERDLIAHLWCDRPKFPCQKIWIVEEKIAGKSVEQKLEEVRHSIDQCGADGLFLNRLDDLMWLFNIRGGDIMCNPVAMSYGYIEKEKATLFIQKNAIDETLYDYFKAHNICLEEYGTVLHYFEGMSGEKRVLVEEEQCSYSLYKAIEKGCTVVRGVNPVSMLKAVKNETELAHMREVYQRDSAVVVRFIYWLKHTVGDEELTEYSAGAYLDKLRQQTEGFLDLSFPTISAYRGNAAMMHYEAPCQNSEPLKREGMLLVDSGGQYLGGTTDVTRTIVLGEVTQEEKEYFTAVASGMLQLSDAKFLQGCTGRNLDILARQPVWDMNRDYKCGTGHGIGYMLNVHEGPQNIRWRYQQGKGETVLEEGMVVTNEPGIYIEGNCGIRIENVLVVRKGAKNEDGQFLHFETLTWVPIDLQAIDVSCMTAENIKRLNRYHEKVYENIAPFLTDEEAAWLRSATAPIRA